MNADRHTVCPKCHPDLVGYSGPHHPFADTGVIDHAAEELGYARDVRENYEFYMRATGQGVELVANYSADCWTCDWHFSTTFKAPVKI